MSIMGSWNIGYVYYGTNQPLSAAMTITSDSPLRGTCTIGTEEMQITGAIVNVFNGQWVWFTCTDSNNVQYYFMGCIEPSLSTICGGTVIPVGVKKVSRGDGDSDDVGTDPGDLGGWVATHQ